MALGHILQIFLRVTVQNQIRIAKRVIIDEVVQFRPLRHGHVQFILDPSAVNGNVKQKRQWTVYLPVDIPTGWEPQRNLAVRALRVAFADFSAAPWQGFEKSERGPNNSSLFQLLAAVVVVAVRILPIAQKESPAHESVSGILGATGRIRTSGLPGRSRTLYPAELRSHIFISSV